MKHVVVASILAALIAGCGGETVKNVAETKPAAPAPLAESPAKQEEMPAAGFRVIGDNRTQVREHAELKADAEQLIEIIKQEMAKNKAILQRYQREGLTPEVPAHGRRLSELSQQAEQKFGLPLEGPLGQCSKMAAMADNVWQTMLNTPNKAVIASSEKSYKDAVKDCKEHIGSVPEPTVKVEVLAGTEPPSADCLLIMNLTEDHPKFEEYTCPASVGERNSAAS